MGDMAIDIIRPADGTATNLGWELVGETRGLPVTIISVDAPPGGGPALHEHTYPELLFVLEGEATFTDGEQEWVVRAGETVYVPAAHPHAFVNSGSGRLRQIDVHLSPRFETRWL
jgi:mannose-6-phosphate isomerase-like protein (cupin superfamily)